MFTRWAISAAVAGGLMLAGGCGSDGDSDRTSQRTSDASTRQRTTAGQEDARIRQTGTRTQVQAALGDPDQFFMVMAAHLNAAEITTARLALERASDPGVRQFAEQMIGDHTRANEELQRLAAKKNLSLPIQPDEAHRMLANHLEQLDGEAFDREYISAMVADHAAALSMMQDRARLATDPAVRDFADRQTAIMRDHLEMAQELNRRIGAGSDAAPSGRSNGGSMSGH